VAFLIVVALSCVTSGGGGALRNAPRAGRMKEKIETEVATGDLIVTEMTRESPIDQEKEL